MKRKCPYCGTDTELRAAYDGGGYEIEDLICEACFIPTDDGPCFDDLPIATKETAKQKDEATRNDDCPVRCMGPLAVINWRIGVAQRLMAYADPDFYHKEEIARNLALAEEEVKALRDEEDRKREGEAAA